MASEDIFVFGSNLAGVHGKGAALVAAKRWGAQWGVGEGPTGRAYAIATKHTPYVRMALEQVRVGVDRFVAYAQAHPDSRFLLTKIGCGLAGFSERDIAPLFESAPVNVVLIDEEGRVACAARDWASRD